MKTKTNKILIVAILSWPTLMAIVFALIVASAPCSKGNLIDLTPGGFDLTQPFPTVVEKFFESYGHMQNLAGANIVNGVPVWSPFTIFGDDHFSISLGTSGADVGWDLTGTGYRSLFVFVESSDLIGNLYAMPWRQRFSGTGLIDDGSARIDGVTFTGTNLPVPDAGSTLAMMGIGLMGLCFYTRKIRA